VNREVELRRERVEPVEQRRELRRVRAGRGFDELWE